MTILTGQQRQILVWGGQKLTVRSNNPNVVPNDGFAESQSRADGLRLLTLTGKAPGTSMLEATLNSALWVALQVNVVDVDLSGNPPKDDRNFAGALSNQFAPLGPAPALDVASMGLAAKLAEAVRRSIPLLPDDAKEMALALVSPDGLKLMAGTTAFWIASHAFGIGEAADLILLLAGVAMLGKAAVDAAKILYAFATTASGAASEADLDLAANYFAKAVVLIGITTVSALLLRRAAGPKLPKPAAAAALAPVTDGTLYARTATTLNIAVIKNLVVEAWSNPGKWPVKVFKIRPGQSVGAAVDAQGYITTENAVAGAGLRELERRLGFESGYLGDAAAVVRLKRLPNPGEFELRFYNNVHGGGVGPANARYPLGPGYPQWELTSQVPATIVKIIKQ